MDAILREIFKKVEARDWESYQDALSYIKAHFSMDDIRYFRYILERQMREKATADVNYAYRMSFYVAAPYDFDSFMTYMECDRKPEERFWLPRRKKLLPLCQALQDLEDGKFDELFISQPPRTGKSQLVKNFIAWAKGRDTEHPLLYCSYSDTITTTAYNGVMEILTDYNTYKYAQVFPNAQIARTNAKDEIIDLGRRKGYPSMTFRSLYGTLNGSCDAEGGYIVSDDLISGIEEALNKDRLIAAWGKVENNLLTRGKGGTRLLWIGTRWSISDPIGIRIELLENDKNFENHRWKVISVPALDENDESNFEYDYGVGFSTEYYQQRRASFERNKDEASWQAQYQNCPIEREGTVFAPDDMQYFNGELPEGEPDRVFMAIDPSFGGADYTASPVCVQYGDLIYVPDVVYDNSEKNITQRNILNKVKKHDVKAIKVEGTKMTGSYGEELDQQLKGNGIRVNMQINTKHWTGTGKEQRIFDHAPSIREHFVFLASGHRSKEYELFMQNVFSFKIEGKNKHDDAPDSLCMADDFAFFKMNGVVNVMSVRPF